MSQEQGLPEQASGSWDRVVEEATELAVEYREKDWEAVVVHPGDVTMTDKDDYFGLNVLAPDSEYERVRSLVETHRFDRSHVYRQSQGSFTFLVCAFEATEEDIAVLVPAFVSVDNLDVLEPRAREANEMPIIVRPLEYEEQAILTVADPDLFFDSDP